MSRRNRYIITLMVLVPSLFCADYGADGATLGKSLRGYFSDNSKTKVIEPINTTKSGTSVDGKSTYSGQISCGGASSSSYLELSYTNAGGGDLKINANMDRDLNGAKEYFYSTSVPVSGVCSNGFVSCDSGTWNNCSYYKWGYNGAITTSKVSRPDLGGCYCINNSCGGLSSQSPESILQSLGNGLTTLMMQYSKSFTVTKTNTTPSTASYWGQNADNCVAADGSKATLPSVSPTTTYALPNVEEAKAIQSQNPLSAYSVLNSSANNVNLGISTTTCEIKNNLSVKTSTVYESCTQRNWNGQTWCLVSQAGYFNQYGGSSGAVISNVTVNLKNGQSLYAINDGHGAICDDDGSTVRLNYTGPTSGNTVLGCGNGVRSGNVQAITSGSVGNSTYTINNFSQHHSGGGWDFYNIYVLKSATSTLNSFAPVSSNTCSTDKPDCKIREEQVCDKDGTGCVTTIKNYVKTGIQAPEVCYTQVSGGVAYLICASGSSLNYVGSDGSTQSFSTSPGGFLTKRTYECTVQNDQDFSDVKKARLAVTAEGNNDLKNFTYTGTEKNPDGTWKNTSGSGMINFTPPPQVQYCQINRSDSTKEVVYSDGTNKANTTTSTATITTEVRECTGDKYDVCPLKSGEWIKQSCGNINDMAEVVGTLEGVNAAAKDMICSQN